ncbi:isochorismate synthase [Ornithinibacillus sp. L9]|uniref:Isochorismate synthase MenF n=1 Tax=Ornithinibacillus caprae TaxID=2678566 RepID=A0A6N8FK59_9BACI|nr:isochorismate synthase [Ornithinibacillus caprae]MUK90042.1 isochorismate synthase [Ornithinibacillus caprae]
MLKIKEDLLESMLDKAIHSIQSSNIKLVSYTKQLDDINPLSFFEAAKSIRGNRSFWKSSVDDFYMVGVGAAFEIETEQPDILYIENKWQTILEDAMIHNPYQVPGTGIVALGGMAFDPYKKSTDLWKNYNASQFTIPEFTLTKHNGNFYFTSIVRVNKNDHAKQLLHQLKGKEKELLSPLEDWPEKVSVVSKEEIKPEQWKQTVQKATEEIKKCNAEKIVLAREIRLQLSNQAEVSNVLEQLIDTQPTSYIFAFEHGEDCFIGATPERLVKLEGRELLSTCLAGTAPRGMTEEEDQKYKFSLLQDQKNREEHDFVVQMIKHAMEEYCENIDIPNEPVILALTNLQHLYTPVRATLKEGYSILNIIDNLHPTPALGGTPRKESLEFIRHYEQLDRGWYGAPIGWLDSNENGEFAVAIRSGLIQGNRATLFAGCGIVEDSNPEAEYEETNIKFLPMLSVLGGL